MEVCMLFHSSTNFNAREHLQSDLQPYSCISEFCNDYDQLFETREEWIAHELQFHHDEWWCHATHHNDSTVVFQSEEELKNHLVVDHANEFTELQLPFLVDRGKRASIFPFKTCPFCQIPELDLTNIDDLCKA